MWWGQCFACGLGGTNSDGAPDKPWRTAIFHICRRYNSRWQSRIGYLSVDAGVGREIGHACASSSPYGPAADQRICYGPHGMSLEVVGSRCSAKMSKNKIEFYRIIKLELKQGKVRPWRRFDNTHVFIRIKFLHKGWQISKVRRYDTWDNLK